MNGTGKPQPAGYSSSQIADELGVSRWTLSRARVLDLLPKWSLSGHENYRIYHPEATELLVECLLDRQAMIGSGEIPAKGRGWRTLYGEHMRGFVARGAPIWAAAEAEGWKHDKRIYEEVMSQFDS